MTDTNTPAPTDQPGFILGIVSCVCAVLGFFIPFLGLVLAIVGLVCGIKAYKAGKAANYQLGTTLGLIGGLISGISLLFASLAMLTVIGAVGSIGLLGAF